MSQIKVFSISRLSHLDTKCKTNIKYQQALTLRQAKPSANRQVSSIKYQVYQVYQVSSFQVSSFQVSRFSRAPDTHSHLPDTNIWNKKRTISVLCYSIMFIRKAFAFHLKKIDSENNCQVVIHF